MFLRRLRYFHRGEQNEIGARTVGDFGDVARNIYDTELGELSDSGWGFDLSLSLSSDVQTMHTKVQCQTVLRFFFTSRSYCYQSQLVTKRGVK